MANGAEAFSDLLSRARAGDRQAWEEVFSRLADDGAEGAALLHMARRVLPPGDRARDFVESRDLMQSALRSGWLDASAFQGGTEAELLAWIRTILRRKLSRTLRRKDPRPGGEAAEEKGAAEGGSTEEAPVAALVREEVRVRVREAVASLPEDQRTVMEMRLEGLAAPEIAEILGLTPEAVRKRESRAAARLREALQPE